MFQTYIRPPSAGQISNAPSSYMASAFQIRRLPDLLPEIHLVIFNYLLTVDQDVLNFGLTCKAFNALLKRSLFVLYRRSLHKRGFRDNPHCYMPLDEKWTLFQDRTLAWMAPNPVMEEEVPKYKGVLKVNNVALSPEALLGWFTEYSSPAQSKFLILKFPYKVLSPDPPGLEFTQGDCIFLGFFPTSMQNREVLAVGSALLEHDSFICAIQSRDPAYPGGSKLVIGRYDCSRRELNSARATFRLSLGETVSRVAMEAAGENLAISFQSRAQHGEDLTNFYVFDLDTFRSKLEISSWERVSDSALVFLSEGLLLNPSSSACALDIYSIPQTTALENGTAEPSTKSICSLGLPPLETGNHFSSIDCKCSLNPTAQDAFPRHLSRPFLEDPKRAIIVFAITVRREGSSQQWNFLMVVHRRALLDVVNRNVADTSNVTEPRVIPWDEWGPPIVRWFPAPNGVLPPSWGQRLFETQNHALHVLNFNPKETEYEGLLSDMLSGPLKPTKVEMPTTSVFQHWGAFKGEVNGDLQYIRQVVQPMVAPSKAWFDGMRFLFTEESKDESGVDWTIVKSLYFG
ncbi:hypothetical protein M413DRAFT_24689 [Hebeloma cylindrosporum]|uniref:F-box domain-containing protein n=1 Tax=Hebeloma cylindrosporum TaxID=76867 RepID=A0A0C3CNU8_HEBCY|nr:hypothetical protein M413DRAFT_24689 [Hebeloma cylindrosporum h7]